MCGYIAHLFCRVQFAGVMASAEFINISVEVPDAHFVVCAVVPAFEQCPEGFYAVGVCFTPDVFAY